MVVARTNVSADPRFFTVFSVACLTILVKPLQAGTLATILTLRALL